jgi:hypothetical protein
VGRRPASVVAFGDTIIHSAERQNLLRRLIEGHHASRATCTFAVEEVSPGRRATWRRRADRRPGGPHSPDFPIASLVGSPTAVRAEQPRHRPRYVFQPPSSTRSPHAPWKSGEIRLTDSIGILPAGRPVAACD